MEAVGSAKSLIPIHSTRLNDATSKKSVILFFYFI